MKENNFASLQLRDLLVDPSILDFRPVEDGQLTQGPEIIGPYKEFSQCLNTKFFTAIQEVNI